MQGQIVMVPMGASSVQICTFGADFGQIELLQKFLCDSLDNNAYTYVYAANSFIRRPADWSVRLATPSARHRG